MTRSAPAQGGHPAQGGRRVEGGRQVQVRAFAVSAAVSSWAMASCF
jgi:hypothetical protein